MNALKNALRSLMKAVIAFFKRNITTFANILNVLMPYFMYIYGVKSANGIQTNAEDSVYNIVYAILIPLVTLAIVFVLKNISKQVNHTNMIPIPPKRFTSVDDDGETSIETARLQEMIIYVSEVEDYLERKGLL